MAKLRLALYNVPFYIFLILSQYGILLKPVHSIWTSFDLVRSYSAWGSSGKTPFLKIPYPGDKKAYYYSLDSSFGSSISTIGDLNGDGNIDIAVGATGEKSYIKNNASLAFAAGAVYILFLEKNGTVKSHQRIGGSITGGPILVSNDRFGAAITTWQTFNNSKSYSSIAVGAPGTYVGTVYILFLFPNGTCSHFQMIRGSIGNGPSIKYGSSFGSSLTNLGDLNKDGIPDLAVGAQDDGGGGSQFVHILFMNTNGTVHHYKSIGANIGGGPSISSYSSFGCAVTNMGDLNQDGVVDIAIGSKLTLDSTTGNPSGTVYVCFLTINGTAKKCVEHSASEAGGSLPFNSYDYCGAAVTNIQDLNRDDMRSRHYGSYYKYPRPQINDMLIGCPESISGTLTGKIIVVFLDSTGKKRAYKLLIEGDEMSPKLSGNDRFGSSLSRYIDIDENGINEILVGAPGGSSGGNIYMLFLRRRRYHPAYFNYIVYWLKVTMPFVGIGLFICCLCVCFCWYFRRKPTEIEEAIKEQGVETGIQRKRHKTKKKKKEEYVDHYYD